MLTDDMAEVFIISGHTVQNVRQELRSAAMCVHVCVSVKVLRHGFKVEVRVSGWVRVRMRNWVMYYESPHKDKNLRM